ARGGRRRASAPGDRETPLPRIRRAAEPLRLPSRPPAARPLAKRSSSPRQAATPDRRRSTGRRRAAPSALALPRVAPYPQKRQSVRARNPPSRQTASADREPERRPATARDRARAPARATAGRLRSGVPRTEESRGWRELAASRAQAPGRVGSLPPR